MILLIIYYVTYTIGVKSFNSLPIPLLTKISIYNVINATFAYWQTTSPNDVYFEISFKDSVKLVSMILWPTIHKVTTGQFI
jgi:hypothetical protein